MSTLPINPLANLVQTADKQIVAQLTSLSNGNLPGVSDITNNLGSVNGLVDKLGGGLTSGLNGITSGATGLMAQAQGALGGAGSTLTNAVSGATSGLGGIGSSVQSLISNGPASTLQSVAGSVSNVTADISGAIGKLTGGSLLGGLQNLASTISGAAGALNNILSLKRAANLPGGGQSILAQQPGAVVKLNSNAPNDWRVRINTAWENFGANPMFQRLSNTGGVVWPYLPNITFSTKATYTNPEVLHNNFPIQAYKNSMVDDISISGEFSCETEEDAAYWIAATTFFKTATKMFFGQGANAGNPPVICILSGYGSSIFENVPVVIKSFSVELKDDVNYITCNTWGTNTHVPVISTVTVVCSPVYSRTDMRKFSLASYANGQMVAPSGARFI